MKNPYVLCRRYPDSGKLGFIGGSSPLYRTYVPYPGMAVRFDSIEAALQWKDELFYEEDMIAFRVHELLPDGGVVDVEPHRRRPRRKYDLSYLWEASQAIPDQPFANESVPPDECDEV